MNKMSHLSWIIVFLLGLSFYGCEIESGETFHFTPLAITAADLPEEFVINQVYDIPVTLVIPDGCTSFEGFTSSIGINNTRTVEAIGIVQTVDVCTQAIRTVEHSFQLPIEFIDTYNFRFYSGQLESGEATYLEYSIPVVSESSTP